MGARQFVDDVAPYLTSRAGDNHVHREKTTTVIGECPSQNDDTIQLDDQSGIGRSWFLAPGRNCPGAARFPSVPMRHG
jgi:hypothetical protein